MPKSSVSIGRVGIMNETFVFAIHFSLFIRSLVNYFIGFAGEFFYCYFRFLSFR